MMLFKRRTLSLLLALVLLFSLGSCLTASADTSRSAADTVSAMGLGWNLGNSFDATGDWIVQYTAGTNKDFETAWGNPVTPAKPLMAKLKRLGFRSVRIPVTWHYHFDDHGNIDATWLSRVQEVVDAAVDEGLYTILNIHHDTGADGWLRASAANYKQNSAVFARLWEQIAACFANYPDLLLFEGFNEMLDENNEWNNPSAEAAKAINDYNQLFVNTVRAVGGKNSTRNLICVTYAGAMTDDALKNFTLPKDTVKNHLIAEVHFYTPYEFVSEKDVTWTKPIKIYNSYVQKSVDDCFSRLKKYLGTTPLIIGEFATMNKNNTSDRIKWYTRVVGDAAKMNAACFMWDNGNGEEMGHLDRTGDNDPFPDIVEACVREAGQR